jgi:hypothetical protein
MGGAFGGAQSQQMGGMFGGLGQSLGTLGGLQMLSGGGNNPFSLFNSRTTATPAQGVYYNNTPMSDARLRQVMSTPSGVKATP